MSGLWDDSTPAPTETVDPYAPRPTIKSWADLVAAVRAWWHL